LLVFEDYFVVCGLFAGESTLMHQVMVVSAQQYKIIEICFSTISPVLYVVSIHEFVVGTAGKPTPIVPNA